MSHQTTTASISTHGTTLSTNTASHGTTTSIASPAALTTTSVTTTALCSASPTYQVPLIDTTASYCIMPMDHSRLATCCAPNVVHQREDCFFWCDMPSVINSSTLFSTSFDNLDATSSTFMDLAKAFTDCLEADGGETPTNLTCVPDAADAGKSSGAPVTYSPTALATGIIGTVAKLSAAEKSGTSGVGWLGMVAGMVMMGAGLVVFA